MTGEETDCTQHDTCPSSSVLHAPPLRSEVDPCSRGFDWLVITYTALFSALLSRLIALACGSTWLTSFIAFFVLFCFFKYTPKLCTYSAGMAGATWNCSRLGAFCVHHTTMHHVTSCKATYRKGVCMFSCNLPPALLVVWPGSFTCYCVNTRVERIPK